MAESSESPRHAAIPPRLLLALALLLAICMSRGIGSVALIDPDEGRNAAVGAEMAVSGNWVVPHYNGLPYLDKPPVLFAAIGVGTAALGRTELAARLPALAFTLATAALLFLFGRRLYDDTTGLLAAVVLLSCPLVAAFARVVIFDAVMMFWVTASFVALYIALEEGSPRAALAAWAAAGLGVLTKGPVGLVLPLLLAIVHALVVGRPLGRTRPLMGLLVFATIVGPWFASVCVAHPEFLHYALVRETLERVATDRMQRTGPPYYFFVLLALGAAPWIAIPAAAPARLLSWWQARRAEHAREAFLMLWILVPLVFFTLSQSKRAGYILPVFPALALVTACAALAAPSALRRAVTLTGVVAAVLGVVGVAGAGLIAARIDPGYPELVAVVPAAARSCGLGLCVVAALAWWGRTSGRAVPALVALATFVVPPSLAAGPVLAAVATQRSARALAEAVIAAETDAGGALRVVAIDRLSPSLPFYLGRGVVVTTDDGSAIRSNYIQDYLEPLSRRADSPLRGPRWWETALEECERPTVFVAYGRDQQLMGRLGERLPRIDAAGRYAAFGPCVP